MTAAIEVHNRLHDLARAPTVAPSSVYANACHDGAEIIKTQQKEIERLREALRPFAIAARGIPLSESDERPFMRIIGDAKAAGTFTEIKVRDMRLAAVRY